MFRDQIEKMRGDVDGTHHSPERNSERRLGGEIGHKNGPWHEATRKANAIVEADFVGRELDRDA